MINDFKVRKEIFEDTEHEKCHFELKLDDKEYQGYYKDDEVSWFQMQPDQDDHEMKLEDLEIEVKKRVIEWKEDTKNDVTK